MLHALLLADQQASGCAINTQYKLLLQRHSGMQQLTACAEIMSLSLLLSTLVAS
jgi:hypothetical protein